MNMNPHTSPIKLIVTDVDGTFLPKTRILTERTHKALKMLSDLNIPVILASSRPPRGMEFILEQAGFWKEKNSLPLVSMNGALITTTKGTTLFSGTLDTSIMQELYTILHDLIEAKTLNFMVLDAEEWWSSGDDDLVQREAASLRFPPIIADAKALQERLTKPANKITLLGQAESVAVAKERINNRFSKTISASSPFNPRFLDITALNVHKGTAVQFLAKHFNLETEHICALGDGENDVDMFRVAGVSVAMGHATEAVRSNATHLTESHAEDGWANAIFRLLGGE